MVYYIDTDERGPMMKKLMCLVATEKGYVTLKTAVEKGYAEHLGCVASFPEVNMSPAFHGRIEALCREAGIPFYWWADIKADIPGIIRRHGVTGMVAISWRFMLPLDLNTALEDDIIIFHDSLLPQYRGFAPTATAMLCGERTVGITALYANEVVDAGDIILQRSMEIGPDEDVAEVIRRQAGLYAEAFLELVDGMKAGTLAAVPQDESMASYSLWRSPEDCRIDWMRPARQVYNLVRACGPPYPGAYTMMDGEKVVVLKAKVLPDIAFAIRDEGKVWRLEADGPLVVCGSGLLKILKAVDAQGQPVQWKRLRVRFQ